MFPIFEYKINCDRNKKSFISNNASANVYFLENEHTINLKMAAFKKVAIIYNKITEKFINVQFVKRFRNKKGLLFFIKLNENRKKTRFFYPFSTFMKSIYKNEMFCKFFRKRDIWFKFYLGDNFYKKFYNTSRFYDFRGSFNMSKFINTFSVKKGDFIFLHLNKYIFMFLRNVFKFFNISIKFFLFFFFFLNT